MRLRGSLSITRVRNEPRASQDLPLKEVVLAAPLQSSSAPLPAGGCSTFWRTLRRDQYQLGGTGYTGTPSSLTRPADVSRTVRSATRGSARSWPSGCPESQDAIGLPHATLHSSPSVSKPSSVWPGYTGGHIHGTTRTKQRQQQSQGQTESRSPRVKPSTAVYPQSHDRNCNVKGIVIESQVQSQMYEAIAQRAQTHNSSNKNKRLGLLPLWMEHLLV